MKLNKLFDCDMNHTKTKYQSEFLLQLSHPQLLTINCECQTTNLIAVTLIFKAHISEDRLQTSKESTINNTVNINNLISQQQINTFPTGS